MTDLGFWKLATADPDHLALIDARRPQRCTAGDLLAQRQPARARAARASASRRATRRHRAAERRADDRAVPRRHAGGLVPDADQPPPDRGRDRATSSQTRDAKAFVADERFAAACRAAADEAGVPARGALRGRSDRRLPALRRRSPPASRRRCPSDRAAGQVMNYTSGTTGRPKGVRRALTPFDPDTVVSMFAMFLGMFGIQPQARQRPPRRLAALPHGGAGVRRLLAALRAHGRADGQVDARELRSTSIAAPSRHDQPHGADAVPSPARAARRR